MARRYALVEAPSVLGLKPTGVERLPARLLELGLAALRRLGAREAARQAVAHLSRPELDGFFIHLDADSLDDALCRRSTTACRTA